MSLNGLIDSEAELNFVKGVQEGLIDGDANAHRALAEVPSDALNDRMVVNYYRAIRRLYKRGEVPEMDLIRLELQSMGAISDDREWIPYLAKFSEASLIFQTDVLGKRLVELHQRRKAYRIFGQASEHVLDPMQDHAAIIQEATQKALEAMSGSGDALAPTGDEILAVMERGERFAADKASSKLGWFGIPALDQDVRASAGELVIIAARPGKGKTALLVQTLANTILDRENCDEGQVELLEGHPCLFVSLELPKEECQARLASWFTRTRSGKFWAGHYGKTEECTVREHRSALNRLFVWATPSRTPWSRIEAKIRGAVIRKGVRVVAIDYFGLIGRPEPGKGQNPYYVASELSGMIRSLAQQLGICIVLLCQLNREGAEGEPGMEDLRETGSLEQDAQTILALYTTTGKTDPMWKGVQKEAKVTTHLKILKNRNGKVGTKLELDFDGATNRFEVKP